MNIKQILQKENILLNIEASTKEEVIQQLAELLYQSNKVLDLKQFIKDVFVRESLGFTGAGNGVAIPHGESDVVENVAIAIGRTTHPINWETSENIREEDKAVSLIILFAVPTEDVLKKKRVYIEALKLLMERLADYKTLRLLLQAADETELFNKITQEIT